MCKWYQLHDWVSIKKIENGVFMGEKYSRKVLSEYRICSKCNLIQGFMYDSQGGQWLDEVPEFQTIIKSKLKRIDKCCILVDKDKKW